MTNQELAERIMGDLNELIDKRGNKQLIPALVEVRKFLDEITQLKDQIAVLESMYPIDDEHDATQFDEEDCYQLDCEAEDARND